MLLPRCSFYSWWWIWDNVCWWQWLGTLTFKLSIKLQQRIVHD